MLLTTPRSPFVWHQRLLLAHTTGTEFMVSSPDCELVAEDLSLANPDPDGFRGMLGGGDLPRRQGRCRLRLHGLVAAPGGGVVGGGQAPRARHRGARAVECHARPGHRPQLLAWRGDLAGWRNGPSVSLGQESPSSAAGRHRPHDARRAPGESQPSIIASEIVSRFLRAR